MNLTLPILASGLMLSGAAYAHPRHGHSPTPAPVPAEEPSANPSPESYPELVAALADELIAAETALANTKIADFIRACRQIEDLTETLPARATSLPEDKRKTAEATSVSLTAKVVAVVGQARAGDLTKAKAGLADMKADVTALNGLSK